MRKKAATVPATSFSPSDMRGLSVGEEARIMQSELMYLPQLSTGSNVAAELAHPFVKPNVNSKRK